MKVALVTLNDSADVHQWSGLNYHIARCLERAGATLHRVGPLATRWTLGMRIRQRWYDSTGRTFHAVLEPAVLDSLGEQARAQIPTDVEAVVAVTSLIAAALGPLDVPLILWDDATNASMSLYYPDFQRMPAVSVRHSEAMGRRAAESVTLALYASEWAATSAREAYGIPTERVAVVPFGANLEHIPDGLSVERSLAERPADVCRLLWVGVDWVRKGGPLTLDIAQALHDMGIAVELAIIGCDPGTLPPLPGWACAEGFISKRTAAGEARLAHLFARSHFFVMPSSAEAYGLVYAEAAAFGVPSVAIATGGVSTIILDDETGILVPRGSLASECATRLADVFRDSARYHAMARAARGRAESLLNWDVAGATAMRLIQEVVHRHAR